MVPSMGTTAALEESGRGKTQQCVEKVKERRVPPETKASHGFKICVSLLPHLQRFVAQATLSLLSWYTASCTALPSKLCTASAPNGRHNCCGVLLIECTDA